MWKIITDSGCNITQLPVLNQKIAYQRVPLTLQVGQEIFVDDEGLDIEKMLAQLSVTQKGGTSACPSPDAYQRAYEGADKIIVLTITGSLSGSHNSAQLAKAMFLEEHPEAQIYVLDSLSAGGEMDLLLLKLVELISKNQTFDEVVDAITAYHKKTKLAFILAKVDNLVKNGRLNKMVGKVVGLLNIRMVGQASSEGKLELLQKARGQKKSVTAVYEEMLKAGYQGGRVMISHCHNRKLVKQLTEMILVDFPKAQVESIATSGLCSFYAEEGGILMGYELLA